jgi:hypothetical protein
LALSHTQVANMLYLESPAGSGGDFAAGSSECLKGGKAVRCHWDDVSQGEAYAHTLAAFHKAFPEFSHSDLYLTGESYFGQYVPLARFDTRPDGRTGAGAVLSARRGAAWPRRYGPNIANYILTHAPFNSTLNLKGIAAGNACWGGSATSVSCNGPNSERNDLEMYYGKGLISKKLYTQVHETCGFGSAKADPFGEAPCVARSRSLDLWVPLSQAAGCWLLAGPLTVCSLLAGLEAPLARPPSHRLLAAGWRAAHREIRWIETRAIAGRWACAVSSR